ncbi:MAG: DUF1670 domain-containing protein [Chloroflexi bacterium]|nr:DUF1670 domain-containing protein [Chloroflexota bacterium]MBU1660735.1 DUF1670 domain-containing protein [Chloroflexota bacterium]
MENRQIKASRNREKRRLARLVKAADEQGGALTVAELRAIVNRSYDLVRKYLREWEEEMGETLPTKGYRMDQGSRPTHKGDIIHLYEQGLEHPDIARETGHNQNRPAISLVVGPRNMIRGEWGCGHMSYL